MYTDVMLKTTFLQRSVRQDNVRARLEPLFARGLDHNLALRMLQPPVGMYHRLLLRSSVPHKSLKANA